MRINLNNNLTLKQTLSLLTDLKNKGHEVWIEGCGNGNIRIIVKNKFVRSG